MKIKRLLPVALLVSIAVLAGSVLAQSGGGYTLTRSTFAGGGQVLSGGGFTLQGTVGQAEAKGILTGAGYNLTGGFWGQGLPVIVSTPGAPPIRNYFTTHTVTLTWNRVSWAVGYQIQVARDKLFTSIVWSDATLSADTLSVTTPYLANAPYYWRVAAKVDAVKWSGWSAYDTFTVNAP